MVLRRAGKAAVVVGLMLTATASLSRVANAQAPERSARGRAPGIDPALGDGVSPGELQRLFDAYVVMQAQNELQLSDEQYARFMSRMRALQETRRRAQMERGRILQELRRLTIGQNGDEAALRAALRRLADADAKMVSDVRQATDGVDQVLDVRQQARFRLFEEQMERRKVELLLRARQARRGPQ